MTAESVRSECYDFDNEAFTKRSEEALERLLQHFPFNTEISEVFLKIVVLNKFYSTRMYDIDIHPFAFHIAELGIDEGMQKGWEGAVEAITDCTGVRRYYSFATKYCSWHNPTAYPIYDRYVDECLWAYNKQDHFLSFHRKDLSDYKSFIEIVNAFRKHYCLGDFSFRQLDKFLWLTGRTLHSEH